MSTRPNPTVIGAFVVGGIALFVAALFLFGSMDWFKEKRTWVTYFDGSVEGLAVGAPVNFRGVKVGTVTDVQLRVDVEELKAQIPVYFQIDRSHITWVGPVEEVRRHDVVKAGLRSKLAMQSLVTGQMAIELDLLPDTPARLVGADPKVPEIPSVPSDIAILKEKFAKLPLDTLVSHIDQLAVSADRLLNSPETANSLKAINETLKETQQLITEVRVAAVPLLAEASASIRDLSAEGKATLSEYRKLAGSANNAVGDLRTSLRSADKTLQETRTTLASVNGLVANDTESRADIETALDNLSKASESLRAFADTLERKPNAIIVGK